LICLAPSSQSSPVEGGKGSGLNSVKARGVIDEQFLLALLADIVSFEEDIDRAVETVAVRDIGAINPALVAELFDVKREHFLIDLEAEVNLSALDVFLGKCLPL